MGINARVPNNDPATPCWTVRHVVQMLQDACPNHWQKVIDNCLDSTNPANLTPAEFAKFTEHVFWVVKQYGIRDPAAFLTYQVQLEAEAAPAKFGSPPKIGDIPVQSKSAECEPGRNNYSTIRVASPPRPVARTLAWGTTKAEVLSCAKAAVEVGEDLRISAERLASAQEDFHASLREIGREIGRSASWISRLLKWRRSGYLQSSPFGPTTRAGRAARRNSNNNDANGCRGGEQQTSGAKQSAGSIKFTDPSIPQEPSQVVRPDSDGAAPMGPHGQTSHRGIRGDASDNSNVTAVECCSPAYQLKSLSSPRNENLSGSTQNGLLPRGEVAEGETDNSPLKRDPSGSKPLEKQPRPAKKARPRQKLSPERMRIVLDCLREYPILARAALEAGIHRRTLDNWIKRSKDGDDVCIIEWQEVTCRFHEHCEDAIVEAHEKLDGIMIERALGYDKVLTYRGRVVYKTDQALVGLGYQGPDAYLKDENGNPVPETIRKVDKKAIKSLLESKRPETYGKNRKIDVPQKGGVLVLGDVRKKSEHNTAASVRANKWKAAFRTLYPHT